MPPVLTKNGDQLELALAGCRGMEFMDAKEKIKEIPGRRFDFETKMWIVPADPQTAERVLKTIRPECDQELLNWISASKATHEESLTSPLPEDSENLAIAWARKRMPWQPESVNDEPYNGLLPYQRAAVDVIAGRGRAILADDMGLGKTFEAISAVEEWCLRNGQVDGPRLVVAPASVKGGWARELGRWLDNVPVVVVNGSYSKRRGTDHEHERLGHERDANGEFPSHLTPDEVRRLVIMDGIEANAWIIVNWEQLIVQKEVVKLRNGGRKTVIVMKEPLFEKTEWLAVIADEVHRAKNRKAGRTQGLWRVRGKVMIGLTGTPIMNSPDELWSILRWLWPEQYHEQGAKKNAVAYWTFYEEFVDYWEDHFKRKVITGVKNPDALRFSLKDKLIRRTAAILGLKGRKRFYYSLPLNPKQQRLYDEAEKAMWLEVIKDAEAGDTGAASVIERLRAGENIDASTLYQIPNGAARMVRLQQIIETPALLGGDDDSAGMDDFEQKFADSRPNQWVVFCKFKESCDILAERLRTKHGATVGVYHGDVQPSERTKLEDRFQVGELDVMIGTIGAMKEGITLTNAHLMYWLTRSWVPAENEQGEAREDRLGQQELVRVYIPLAESTVAADKVEPTNRLKEKIVRTVIPQDKIKEDNS